MLRRGKAALCLTVFLLCCGCGRGGAEVTVPQVEVMEEPQVRQTEEQKRAELGLDTEAGTVLGEEEVVMMTEEGEPQTAMYTRVRGNGDFSLAYDTSEFSLTASENELRFEALSDGEADAASAFLSLRKEDAPSAEELADQKLERAELAIALPSDWKLNECFTAQEFIRTNCEYPAIWVSYAEGTSGDSRTCDLYVFRYNEELYVAQLDCTVADYENLGSAEHMILSTLRFDEG